MKTIKQASGYTPGTKSYVLNELHCMLQELQSVEEVRTADYFDFDLAFELIESVRDSHMLIQVAAILGYEEVAWNHDRESYVGYGSSDPLDRSRDDEDGYYIAENEDDLREIIRKS